MDKLTTFGRIVKVNAGSRIVEGIAMDETPDRDGEIYDYDSSKQYVQAWANTQAENTKAAGQEVSYGNLRSQHDAHIAAGKVSSLCFDDKAKAVPIVAKVIDDAEWEKVLTGVYTGFSVKGRQVGKKWRDGQFMRYTVDPIEISLVDIPCNPGATFDCVKADGSTEKREFKTVAISEDDAEIEKKTFSDRRRKDLARQGKALPDGSFPIENKQDLENAVRAIGRAKDPEAAKKHIISRAKDLGATDLLPADWTGSTKEEKAVTMADLEKFGADLTKRLTSATVGKETSMKTPEELAKAAEIKKAAAVEKLKKAQKAHSQVGACLNGYCDHGDTEKCMEKADEAHEAIKGALKDDDDAGETDAEKAAKAAKAADIAKAAAEKAELVEKAKKLGLHLAETPTAATPDPKVAELEKKLAELTEQVAKGNGTQRSKPVLNGKSVSKTDDATTTDETVKKFAELKKDDPNVVAKAASAVLSAQETEID